MTAAGGYAGVVDDAVQIVGVDRTRDRLSTGLYVCSSNSTISSCTT